VAPGAAAIVYAGPGEGGHRLWVKEKGQLSARPLPGTEGAGFPSISPDGAEVAFNRLGPAPKVPLQGGPAVTLADTGWCPTWLDDGTVVYQITSELFQTARNGLRRMSASGGEGEELWPEQPEDRWAFYPAALPESRGVLFTLCDRRCENIMDIWALDLRSGEARQVVTGALRAWYLDPGYVVFIRLDGAVFALPFDVRALKVTGTAVPLLEGVKIDAPFYPDMALARRHAPGALGGGGHHQPGDGVGRPEPATCEGGSGLDLHRSTEHGGFALSPDGTRLAIAFHTDEGDDIWIKELDDGPLLRLTYDPA
jgi:hypothetical protein